ncbi:FtsQ-type POTRA domain-containing protein [Bombilactobacillus folatiphilus]|uniref:Cell division protein DivIB n=1 Tax=Bombilactobacillus folatiphilus TaxID=2923362 RepID=A0ABY4PAQ3_9LACO|nr:cell division protein FtsQ/DivIB [Bombilactobacillus folatiphilus]UQS82705.1 FtsQ-type POTRA domain-containing protein [Bombilactobacillus folatiphilus]
MKNSKQQTMLKFQNQYSRNHQRPTRWMRFKNILRKFSFKNLFLLMLMLGILFIGYLFSPLGHVRTINVTGVNYLGAQQIIDASKIDNNSLVLQTLLIRKRINQQVKRQVPLIKDINYYYTNFNTLHFKVKEYRTVGFVVRNHGYYRILENKKIINSKLKQPIGNFPIYQNLNHKVTLAKTVELYVKCPHTLKSDISEIHGSKNSLKYPYRVELYMNDGNLIIGDIRTLESKLKYYPAIVKTMSKKGVINLEIGAYLQSVKGKGSELD